MTTKKVKAIVLGKVQGVGFRMSTRAQAQKLSVCGTVRNLNKGKVEIIAAGETEPVDALIDWAKSGPPSAVVNDLQTEVLHYEAGEFDTFEICR